jgi:hypothetical protein
MGKRAEQWLPDLTRINVDRETTIIRYRITPIPIYKNVEEEDNPEEGVNLRVEPKYVDL